MVIESIIEPKKASRKPWNMFLLGIIYSSIGVLLGLWVFPGDPSLAMVFLATMSAIPTIISVLKREEAESMQSKSLPLIKNHMDVLGVFFFLFLGQLVAYVAWYIFLPESMLGLLFSSQITTIQRVSSSITGNAASFNIISMIIINNLKVMFFCLLFSLIYGAGAIYIITWNASVLGVAIGNAIRVNISNALSYFHAIPLGFGRYLVHGLSELIAYFLAGIAGGIISAAVVRHHYKSKKFKEVVLDSLDLILVSVALIIISAIIEVNFSANL